MADLDSYIQSVENTILKLTDSATALGYVKLRIDLQKTFVFDLMSTIQASVSQLVDTNMDEESTRLQALETKQALGVQSLSIANNSNQSILKLLSA